MSNNDKKCSKCKTTQPRTEFYRNKANPDGQDAYCKTCRKEAGLERQRALPNYQKDYYRTVTKPKRKAMAEALTRLKELDPSWEPSK